MAGAKTRSKHSQGLCKQYRDAGTGIKNKVRKIKRHIKNQPNDLAAKATLEGGVSLTRKTPSGVKWSATDIYFAQLIKSFGRYKGDVVLKLKAAMTKAYDAEQNKLNHAMISKVWEDSVR